MPEIGPGVSVGNLTAFLGLNDTGFVRGMARATATMTRFSRTMNAVGTTLTTALTVPLIGVGGVAIKSAMQFEKALSEMEGLVGLAREEVQGFRKEIIAMSRDTARGPQELAEALRFVTSSGFQGAGALEVVRVSAMAAAAGMGKTQQISDLVTDAMNAYGHEHLSAARAVDILTEAIAQGKAEPEEMASAIGYVLPLASQLGVEFDDVAASIAFMTRQGADASTAATNLRQMFSDLFDPSAQANAALKKLGVNFNEVRRILREGGTIAALTYLKEQMQGNDVIFGKLFGNVRSLTSALSMTGVQADEARMVFGEVQNKTGQMGRAFAIASETGMFKFNAAMAELKIAGIQLGDALMPLFLDFVQVIKRLANWFSSLGREGKNLTLIIMGIGAAIGPVALVLGSMASIFALISIKVLAVVAALAALGLGFLYLYKNWEAIKERISDWDWWKTMWSDMLDFLGDITIEMEIAAKQMIKKIVEAIKKNWKNPGDRIQEEIDELKRQAFLDKVSDKNTEQGGGAGKDPVTEGTEAVKKYKTEFVSMKDIVVGGWEEIKAKIKEVTGQLGSLSLGGGGQGSLPIPEVGQMPKKPAGPLASPFPPKLDNLVGPIERLETIKNRLDNIRKSASNLATEFRDNLANAIASFADAATDAFAGMLSGQENVLVNLAKATASIIQMYLQQSMAAMIAAHIQDPKTHAMPWAKLALAAAGMIAVKTLFNKLNNVQGLATGGFVTQGGVFQLHKDEMVSLPRGSAVTPAHLARADGGGGGRLSTEINLRTLIIKLDRERERMGR